MARFWTVVICLLLTGTAHAAPNADLWPRWQQHDNTNMATIDHSMWSDFLARHITQVDGINLLDYKRAAQHRNSLDAYLTHMQSISISKYHQNQQMAYWINLYNALTVRVIVDHYPVASILDIDISPGFFSNGPWDAKLIQVEGQMLSLNDIEHRILRPIWKDPRIHYAVNCASMGCPNLAKSAYVAETINEQLDQAAISFINHSRGVSVTGTQVVASKIYDWYASDFGDRQQLIEHWRHYASPQLKTALEQPINDWAFDYDWSLNDYATSK